MYGMIHQSLQEMVSERSGVEGWETVCAAANIDHDAATTPYEVYSDEMTFRLIAAAANKLDLPIDDFMDDFGQSWIHFASQGKYKTVFQACGSDIKTFIQNLDHCHQGVSTTMAGTKIGSFKLLSSGSGWLLFRYNAARPGLGNFLKGLMKGLLVYFDLLGSTVITASDEYTTEILVKFEPNLSKCTKP